MINCHQNEKNDQKGHKTALNSHNCVLLTIFCFQQHHVRILYRLGALAQLRGALLESNVARTQNISSIEFKSGIEKNEI